MTTEHDSIDQHVATPSGASQARVIVFERAGDWAVALRRELSTFGVRVHETRSLPACWELLGQSPVSLVVTELTPHNAQELLHRMAWLERDFPRARVAVVAERALASWEWLMREAGAVHFTVSPRQVGPLASLVLRHLDRAPKPPLSMTDQIWASLPWGRSERASGHCQGRESNLADRRIEATGGQLPPLNRL